jgi:hypothetical protein
VLRRPAEQKRLKTVSIEKNQLKSENTYLMNSSDVEKKQRSVKI